MKKLGKKKTFMCSLMIAVALLLANLPIQAQSRPGGMFGEQDYSTSSEGLMGKGGSTVGGDITGHGFGTTNGNITGQTFGDDAPLGSGLFVLLAAGVGYASMKSRTKQNKQNRKEN